MHISLTPTLESHIKTKVESGLYNNASEVVREALRFMETHEQWVSELKLGYLREQINAGLVQLDEGQGIKLESRDALANLFENIKADT